MAVEDGPLLGQLGSNQNRFRAAGISSLDCLGRLDIKVSPTRHFSARPGSQGEYRSVNRQGVQGIEAHTGINDIGIIKPPTVCL